MSLFRKSYKYMKYMDSSCRFPDYNYLCILKECVRIADAIYFYTFTKSWII